MIRILDKNVADKIAAGEVVDRPLSIVKELVENSIDAGATNITVEMRNGGKTYIRVTDNGSGIPEDQAELAFLRHATSKIVTDEDLSHILTLGFRGEALSSIAAVSRVELISKTADSKTGFSLKIHGGEVFEKVATGCPEGTTIIVSDLFYNTPARLKFMKSDSTESTLIIDFISRIALAYAHIKIRLINNGTILFSTNGKGDKYNNILTVYSKAVGDGLLYVYSEREDMRLEGYISRPDVSKTNKKQQLFYVNGRVINNRIMDLAVQDGYTERLFEGRYPVAYLFFTIQPELVDVNIHPNKKEVRFHRDLEVRNFIAQAIKSGLLSQQAIPQVKGGQVMKEGASGLLNRIAAAEAKIQGEVKSSPSSSQLISRGEKPPLQGSLGAGGNATGEESATLQQKIQQAQVNDQVIQVLKENKQQLLQSEKQQEQVDIKNILSTLAREQEEQNYAVGITPPREALTEKTQKEQNAAFFRELQLTGTIFNTYITAVEGDCFYLIDQHAAHERIFYEKLLGQYRQEEKLRQGILTPLVVEVPYTIKSAEKSWVHILRSMGFDIEPFGLKAYVVKEIPAFMELSEGENLVNYFLENIEEDVDIKNQAKVDRIIMRSCKSAVKANDVLSPAECRQLIEDLALCENPYSCPHGRPTFIKMTKYEIEKMFKRV
ncbi:DNA mismatch repair endonuclease MutL [Aminipila butyrica]|uniref:DNA mismatch repair protein MutL n=1 Tax=Aminipila butyrica TaxID=433296 RepID=A0A858BWF9_9FIRM|nr:DNA mismatch repair endonuclease MutL [Aminipila butyrica]QIB69415.1 DNA mismatch repair endonuclease MutL [Aminipila butyrica]